MKDLWITKTPIAHRGLHSNDSIYPENSLIAIKKAIEKNIPIEIDVQLSKDEEIVVFHDFDVSRMCNKNKKASELTLKELKKLYLKAGTEKIPTLKEVFDIVCGKIPILIEIKNFGFPGKLEKRVNNAIKNYKGKIAIQSFNPFTILRFKKNNPNILRGQLSSSFKGITIPFFIKYILKNMFLNIFTKPDFLAVDLSLLEDLKFRKRYKNKTIILGWTIDNYEKQSKVKELCDNYIFELIDI
ncbi:MAG: glycerophosphodiester phosphodiesterase [candidate division SR1 bacterium]|nr:MAG: glycerophosphodiester phosphodiesterase [candidate division SR1 bacterium]